MSLNPPYETQNADPVTPDGDWPVPRDAFEIMSLILAHLHGAVEQAPSAAAESAVRHGQC